MPRLTAKEGVVWLIERGLVKTQSEAAERLGVSRQYVNQIVNRLGLHLSARSPNGARVVLTCRKCGKKRAVFPSYAAARKTEFCFHCMPRPNRRAERVRFECPICGKERWYAPAGARQRKTQRCRPCASRETYREIARTRPRKTHCKWGHPLSGANLQVSRGARRCRTCHNRRSLEYYWAQSS